MVITDVNDVSVFVDHYVAVVAVLNLEQKPNHTIGSHTLYKIPSRLLKTTRRLVAIRFEEVVIEGNVGLTAQLVPRLGVGNAFNDSTLELRFILVT